MTTPTKYDPDTGQKLVPIKIINGYWISIYENQETETSYLYLLDMKWEYPLIKLNPGVSNKIKIADTETIKLACSRIKRIDYKTISTVDFEHTLLGCYKEKIDEQAF